jgi:glycosyltransferase involved in cell wall biosynthesis
MKNHRQTVEENKNDQCDIFCLDDAYSTTRRITTCPPDLDNKPDDAFETVLFLPEGTEKNGEGGLRTKGYFKKSQVDRPLVSIITVVLNNHQFIKRTIQSILEQSYDNIELIIIDGGSTDGTVDIIKKYENSIDHWVSEKDFGISHAFNKGISLSLGSYIYILNSGDILFCRNSILNAVRNIDNNYFIYSYQVARHMKKPFPVYKNMKTLPGEKSLDVAIANAMSAHQGTLVGSQVYKQIGLYNTNLKIRMDFDFFLRAQKKYSLVCRNEPLASFDSNGISGKLGNLYIFKKEEYMIVNSYQKNINYNIRFFCKLPFYLAKRLFSIMYYSVKIKTFNILKF